jgi:hypothetical protein
VALHAERPAGYTDFFKSGLELNFADHLAGDWGIRASLTLLCPTKLRICCKFAWQGTRSETGIASTTPQEGETCENESRQLSSLC